ncbi:MAG: FAD-dependent 5-carboxymethylaminomethyl-2-thiouridine(34) oxidoreductase MnmC [Pseudomonadota bacterium]
MRRIPTIEQSFIDRCYKGFVKELARLNVPLQASGVHQLTDNPNAHNTSVHWQRGSHYITPQPKQHSVFAERAGALQPSILCRSWMDHDNITRCLNTKVTAIKIHDNEWLIEDALHRVVGRGQLVILANAMSAQRYAPQLALSPASGQINLFHASAPAGVICDSGYVIATSDGVWSGATFRRGDDKPMLRQADELENRQRCQRYWNIDKHDSLRGWSGVRCTTPDRLPVIGAIPDVDFYQHSYRDLHHGRRQAHYPRARYIKGLYVMAGLGSRGLVQALYGSQCLADTILGAGERDNALTAALHPARFMVRQLRKGPR